jgi:predicted deacylase
VIAYTLWQEVITKASAVVDCHGGEYSENMTSYVITHATGEQELDDRTVALAMALGVPFVEVTQLGGVIGRRGGLTTEAVYSGRPGMVMEIGGRGVRDERSIAEVYQALQNAMRYMGIKQGRPVFWAGQPVRLERGMILNTSRAGLWEPAVVNGQWIEKDAVFGRVRDFDGTLLEEVQAPDAGVVITVINARCIEGGENTAHFLQGFAGKIGVIGAGGPS